MEKKLKYKSVLQKLYLKGAITKKKWKKELKWIREFK